jgi:hypothetical protein
MGVRDRGNDAGKFQEQSGDSGAMVSPYHYFRIHEVFPSCYTLLKSMAGVW